MVDVEFVLAYVPEAEYLSWEDAVHLADERDSEAAYALERSVLDG